MNKHNIKRETENKGKKKETETRGKKKRQKKEGKKNNVRYNTITSFTLYKKNNNNNNNKTKLNSNKIYIKTEKTNH